MSKVVDLEVGRFALRTFRFADGRAESLLSSGEWRDGICEARCLPFCTTLGFVYNMLGFSHDQPHGLHRSPHEGCDCGIYGSLSLGHLRTQYPEQTERFVAVIAAEGRTIIGSRGLRTERARVVAYWVQPPPMGGVYDLVAMLFPDSSSSKTTCLARIASESFPGAMRYSNPYEMAISYGVSIEAQDGPDVGGPSWWTA